MGSLHVTGVNGIELGPLLEKGITDSGTRALFVGCAYVSIFGAEFLRDMARRVRLAQVALVADTRDGITHPTALKLALDEGWRTRVVNRPEGTFHPKVFMGTPNEATTPPNDVRMLVLGSNNLSRGGLERNVEAAVQFVLDRKMTQAVKMASSLWNLGEDLTSKALSEYESFFQAVNRRRSVRDMKALGVSDEPDLGSRSQISRTARRSKPSFSTGVAKAVWVGLETQTGEHRLQAELPKKAAEVLISIVGKPPVRFDARCDDGEVREILFDFYGNDMHRLNIPKNVPGVEEARARLTGVALVERHEGHAPPLFISVKIDPREVERIQDRSAALGTWDATPTRFYGWY